MNIVINNAQKLSFSSRFETFGGSLAFKKVLEFVVSVVFSDITNQRGELLSFDDIEALKNTEDYGYISVNGAILKRAKVKTFSLASGPFNISADVSITLEVLEEGDDLLALDGYYADYGHAFGVGCSFVEEISESISIQRGENSVDYSKEIDIKFSNSLKLEGAENPVVRRAQEFAKAIFNYDSAHGYNTIPDLDSEADIRNVLNSSFKKFRNETLDLMSNKCSFREGLRAENIKTAGGRTYSHSATQNIQIAQNGIITVSEQGRIQALSGFYGLQGAQASGAYKTEAVAARIRLQNLFGEYIDCDQNLTFFSFNKNIDDFRGVITYDISANNDKKWEFADDGGISYSRVLSYSKDRDIYQASERGTIEGLSSGIYNGTLSNLQKYPKYYQAYTYFNSLSQTTIYDRIRDFMVDVGATESAISPYPISRSETHSFLGGRVEYERAFSTDRKHLFNDVFKSVTVDNSVEVPTKSKNEFLIVNDSILVQEMAGTTQGSQQVGVNILGYRVNPSNNTAKAAYLDMLESGKGIVSSLAGIGSEDYITSAGGNFGFWNDVTLGLNVGMLTGLRNFEG